MDSTAGSVPRIEYQMKPPNIPPAFKCRNTLPFDSLSFLISSAFER